MISIIAAVGKNFELGKDNDLIWHFAPDMKFFRSTTKEHTVIMGRKTFESLGGLLPKRRHVVLTRNRDFKYDEVEVFESVSEILKAYGENSGEENFVIGGGEVYKLFLPYADKMYLTEINADCADAQVYFPEFDSSEWNTSVLEEFEEDGISARIMEYVRKKS